MIKSPKLSGISSPGYSQIKQYVYSLLSAADESARSRPLTTEHELCALFGVSRGTVRKALRMLVDEGLLIRRQHYGTFINPDIVNVTSHQPIIGVVIGNGDSAYLDSMSLDMLSGVQQALIERNWNLRHIQLHGNAEQTLNAEFRGKVAGIVWIWMPESMAWLREQLREQGMPVVAVFPVALCRDGLTVNLHYEDYGYQFASRMIAKGCSEILFVDDALNRNLDDKQRGVERAFREAGLSWEPSNYLRTAGINAKQELAARLRPDRHKVVGCSGQFMLLRGHFPEYEFITPASAGMPFQPNRFNHYPLLPTRVMGYHGVECLERAIKGQPAASERILFNASFIDRCQPMAAPMSPRST